MVNKEESQGHFYWLIPEVISDFVLASIKKRVVGGWVGLGVGVAVGVNTWLCIVVNGLSKKLKVATCPRGFCNLLRSGREAFASDQTA